MRVLPVVLVMCLAVPVVAQTWYGLSAGGNLSAITHQNSRFEKNKNLKGYPGAVFTFLYQIRLPGTTPQKYSEPSDLLTTEFGYKSAHIKDKSDLHLTTWSFQYLTMMAGGRHYHKPRELMNLYFGGAIVADLLLSGTQSTAFEQYDLTGDIRRLSFGATVDAGLHYHMTEDTFCSIGLGYTRGLRDLEKKSDQQAWLHSWKISVAMIVAMRNTHRIKKK